MFFAPACPGVAYAPLAACYGPRPAFESLIVSPAPISFLIKPAPGPRRADRGRGHIRKGRELRDEKGRVEPEAAPGEARVTLNAITHVRRPPGALILGLLDGGVGLLDLVAASGARLVHLAGDGGREST